MAAKSAHPVGKADTANLIAGVVADKSWCRHQKNIGIWCPLYMDDIKKGVEHMPELPEVETVRRTLRN